MEPNKIGQAMMFGAMVSFCDCPVCKAFLEAEGRPMPVVMGRIADQEKESDGPGAEELVDSMDA